MTAGSRRSGPGRARLRRPSTRLPVPALLPVLALLSLSPIGCSEESTGTSEQPPIFHEGADQVMVEVEHYLTRDGLRRGLLEADTAFTYEDASRIELRNLELQFYDDAGADRGVLTSESGTYEMDTGNLTVRNGVELRGALERGGAVSVLETDSLRYLAADDELSTEARYTLTRPDGTVERGRNLVTDPALQNIRAEDLEVTTPDVPVPE